MDRTRNLQIFSLTLSQRGNERCNIRVAYISFLPRLTQKEVELNREYHALHKYRFVVFLMFIRDHEQLLQLFVGFGCLSHSRSSTLFRTCYISMTLSSHK